MDLSDLDLSTLVLYSPPEAGRFDSWDDVPKDIKDTYEKLGIPQAEASISRACRHLAPGALR